MRKTNKHVSEEVKLKILKDLIEPSYYTDIKQMVVDKKCWKITSTVFETSSKILVACGSIVSFSSGYFGNPFLGFIAGSISTISLAFLQFAGYCSKESKRNSTDVNILLEKLGIDTVPVLEKLIQDDNYFKEKTPMPTSGNIMTPDFSPVIIPSTQMSSESTPEISKENNHIIELQNLNIDQSKVPNIPLITSGMLRKSLTSFTGTLNGIPI